MQIVFRFAERLIVLYLLHFKMSRLLLYVLRRETHMLTRQVFMCFFPALPKNDVQ